VGLVKVLINKELQSYPDVSTLVMLELTLEPKRKGATSGMEERPLNFSLYIQHSKSGGCVVPTLGDLYLEWNQRVEGD
jgi:hypothetical protein